MNYYIQGNKEKADQIKAAFEAKGCVMHTGNQCDLSDMIYYSLNGKVGSIKLRNLDLFKSHPNYKELELPVQPKFKVGDWITNGTFIHCIVSIVDGFYYFYGGGYLDFGKIDGYYHLWTIADAKEGDVLAINWHEDNDSWEKIIIFKNYHAKGVKGLTKEPCVEGYGNTFKNGKLAINEKVPYYSKTWTHNLQPATKEQRDLLFQKMKEAGYKWTAADNGKVQEIINALEFIGKEKMISYNEEIKWLRELKYRFDKDEYNEIK